MTQGADLLSYLSKDRHQEVEPQWVLKHALADLMGDCAGDSSNKKRLEVYDPSPPFQPCPQFSESIQRKYCPSTFS